MNRHHVASTRHLPAPRVGAAPARPWPVLAALAGVTVLSIVGYLVQVSSVSAKSSEIRQLQKEVASLKDERARAELQVAQGSAVAVVESKVRTLGLVPTGRIEYVDRAAAAVALAGR